MVPPDKQKASGVVPEAPHALSRHWSRKIPLGPSLPESSVSQNFFPVSSCCRGQTDRGRWRDSEETSRADHSGRPSTDRAADSPLPWPFPPEPAPESRGSTRPWSEPARVLKQPVGSNTSMYGIERLLTFTETWTQGSSSVATGGGIQTGAQWVRSKN